MDRMNINLKTGSVILGEASETFDILLAGDLCPRMQAEKPILSGNSAAMLADVMDELSGNDLSLINLETPLTEADTPIPKSGPNLKVTPKCIELLKAGGWDVAICANNHIGDYGPDVVMETLERLTAAGIAAVGAGANREAAEKPLVINKKGVKTAILAFAENEFGSADDHTPGANPLLPLRNIAQIRATAATADITLVLIHGGNEFNPIPSPRMIETYRAFAEAGASAVIAGHTHCPQGIEIWKGVPIIYSLSDFIFDTNDVYHGYNWWYGYMVRLGFTAGKAMKLEVIPHHCAPHAEQVSLLRGEEREKFLIYLDHISHIITDHREVKKYFDAWCMKNINGYFARLGIPFHPTDWNDPASVSNLMAMRNLFTCEAHNELATTTLRILEERREAEASAYLPRLLRLCNGEI